jgi:hypothetical protein
MPGGSSSGAPACAAGAAPRRVPTSLSVVMRGPSRFLHRVRRVHEEVDQHLLQLVRVAIHHERARSPELALDLEQLLKWPCVRTRSSVSRRPRSRRRLRHGLAGPREVEQAADDPVDPLRLPLRRSRPARGACRPPAADQAEVADDAPSGLPTSWAMPAPSRPTDAIFSARIMASRASVSKRFVSSSERMFSVSCCRSASSAPPAG